MSIMSDRWIRKMCIEHKMIDPFEDQQVRKGVISYGISSYGYDLRIADEFKIFTNVNSTIVDPKDLNPATMVDFKGPVAIVPPNSFALGRSVEYFRVPRDILCACVGQVYLRPLRHHYERHAVRAGVGGLRDARNQQHHAPSREDLRQRRHRPGVIFQG